MLSPVSDEMSHKSGFNNRTFFFTPKMYRASVPSFGKLWKCQNRKYFSCNRDPSDIKWTQLAREPESLRGSIFKIHFTTVSAFCAGMDVNCDAQASARTKTYFLMSFLILSSLDNQYFGFWTLNVFSRIISHPNVTYKCGSVVALLLRGPCFVCRALSRTNASRSHVYSHSLPPQAAPSSC